MWLVLVLQCGDELWWQELYVTGVHLVVVSGVWWLQISGTSVCM